ncbi:MAG: TerB N-terminal domain-containing protein [Treponema sp.]|jgi:hypothetical protein|nr:TerB N-terminal domain-containing protein [Treponema sp.]
MGNYVFETLDFPFFTLEYHEGYFKRLIPSGAEDLGRGKFQYKGKAYQLPAGADEVLSEPELKGRALISLLKRGQNPLIKKGPRLAHEGERLMELQAIAGDKDAPPDGSDFSSRSTLIIELGFPQGKPEGGEWLPLEGLPRYRLYRNLIHEIIDDKAIRELSENYGENKGKSAAGRQGSLRFVLKGEDIPLFADNYSLLVYQFGDNKLKAMLSENSIFVTRDNLSLVLARGKSGGPDQDYGLPFLAIGEYHYPAEEVSLCMDREYILLEPQKRWVRRQDLQAAGLFPLCCYAGGATIKKVKLKKGEPPDPDLLPRHPLLAANLTESAIISYQIDEKFSGISGPSLYSELALYAADGPPAPFVGLRLLKGNLTIERMDTAEKAFYLYWRTEARRGNFIKTGESYIRIYARELCLFTGVQGGPLGNFSLLLRLWENYREEFPSLDSFIPRWLFDFQAVYEISDDALPLLLPHVFEFDDPLLCDIYIYCHYICENNSIRYRDIRRLLPDEIDENPSSIVNFENTVNAVDRYLRENFHLRFFEFFFPPAYGTEKRTAFAEMERAGRSSYTATTVRFSKNPPLLSFLEKLLREDNAIDFATSAPIPLPGPAHKTQFQETQFQDSRLQELRSDSEAVRDLLAADNREQLTKSREQRAENDKGKHGLLATNADSSQKHCSLLTAHCSLPPAPYSIANFLKALNETELRALKIITLSPSARREIENLAREKGTMPELLIDRINAVFLELSGDLLVETVDEEPTIQGEYKEELKKHLEGK